MKLASSGSRDVEARLDAVNLQLTEGPPAASASGCEGKDFDGFERGAVALVRRGTCQFQVKVDNAVAAGAVGVIIMNEGTDGRIDAFSGVLSNGADVPVVGVPYEFGRSLAARAGGLVRLAVNAVTGKRSTRNVVADASADEKGALIVVGAHLDSVPDHLGFAGAASAPLHFHNSGAAALMIEGSAIAATIAPGADGDLTIASATGTLELQTNDPNHATISIALDPDNTSGQTETHAGGCATGGGNATLLVLLALIGLRRRFERTA